MSAGAHARGMEAGSVAEHFFSGALALGLEVLLFELLELRGVVGTHDLNVVEFGEVGEQEHSEREEVVVAGAVAAGSTSRTKLSR